MDEQRTRIVAGCMTGTSLDGLDVALVKITGTGLDMQAELLGHHALPMPDDLRSTLMSLASGEAREPISYMRAARALGELHADGLEQLITSSTLSPEGEGRDEGEASNKQTASEKGITRKIDFITAHGQTIWHAPRDEQAELGGGPKSWQLFDPWPIVRRLKAPVCYDLRQADLIAGGEGAPLTPIADWVMYRHVTRNRCVINLGGVCNMTLIDAGARVSDVVAEDVCPCNILLDGLTQRLFGGLAFDKDGELASAANRDQWVCPPAMDAEFFSRSRPRSSGREDFPSDWLDALANTVRCEEPTGVLAATAAQIARWIVESLPNAFDRWIDWRTYQLVLAGGGARNQFLVQQIVIEYEKAKHVFLSDSLGIPCEAREAMAFAVLGALSQDGIPISLPQVTGATDPSAAGVWAGV